MFADIATNLLDSFPASSRELTIWVLGLMVVLTLIILVPQLLKAHLAKLELVHQEHLKVLELGQKLPNVDDRSKVAGRMALLVPMVVMIAAATVTCFLSISRIPRASFRWPSPSGWWGASSAWRASRRA